MKVLKRTSMEVRSPLVLLAVEWLLLDRFKAPEWAFGAFWTIALISVACWIYVWVREEPITLDDIK